MRSRTDLCHQLLEAPLDCGHIVRQFRPQDRHQSQHSDKIVILRSVRVGEVAQRSLLRYRVVPLPYFLSLFLLVCREGELVVFVQLGEELANFEEGRIILEIRIGTLGCIDTAGRTPVRVLVRLNIL